MQRSTKCWWFDGEELGCLRAVAAGEVQECDGSIKSLKAATFRHKRAESLKTEVRILETARNVQVATEKALNMQVHHEAIV